MHYCTAQGGKFTVQLLELKAKNNKHMEAVKDGSVLPNPNKHGSHKLVIETVL
jgi:hypothetical protein